MFWGDYDMQSNTIEPRTSQPLTAQEIGQEDLDRKKHREQSPSKLRSRMESVLRSDRRALA
jgi:hypothetical protein